MNKIFTRVIGGALGLAMAVGVGVSLSNRAINKSEAASGALGAKVTRSNFISGSTVVLRKDDTDTYCTGVASNFLATADDNGFSAACEFVATGTSSAFYLQIKSNSKYVNWTGKTKVSLSDTSTGVSTFAINENGILSNSIASGNTFKHNDASHGFRPYADSNTGAPGYLHFTIAQTNITSISSVTLSTYSAPVNYSGATITATAAYGPANANEPFVWSSSNPAVATIEASATYGVANITIVGTGNCTFTAKAKHDASIAATSSTFTVTAPVVTPYYETRFDGNGGDADSTTSLTTDTIENYMTNTAFTFSAVENVFRAAEDALKFSSGKQQGSITFTLPTGDTAARVILRVRSNVTGGSPEGGKLSVTIGDTTVDQTISSRNYTCFVYNFDTAGNEITITGTSGKRHYVSDIIILSSQSSKQAKAFEYAMLFNNTTADSCAELEVTAANWTTVSNGWTSLSAEAKGMFNDASANEDGDLIAKALARYEFIVAKYKYNNFMGRTLGSANVVRISAPISHIDVATIVIIISSISLVALGGFLVIKRKKEQ